MGEDTETCQALTLRFMSWHRRVLSETSSPKTRAVLLRSGPRLSKLYAQADVDSAVGTPVHAGLGILWEIGCNTPRDLKG